MLQTRKQLDKLLNCVCSIKLHSKNIIRVLWIVCTSEEQQRLVDFELENPFADLNLGLNHVLEEHDHVDLALIGMLNIVLNSISKEVSTAARKATYFANHEVLAICCKDACIPMSARPLVPQDIDSAPEGF